MDIISIIIVMLYTIQPYLAAIILLVALLLASLVLGRANVKKASRSSLWLISLFVAIAAMLLAPTITDSALRYVLTWVDKGALLAVGIAAFIYCWLLLRPWLTKPT